MKKYIKSLFCEISKKEAIDMNLVFICNIYGDSINKINCRSIWSDGRLRYRCKDLVSI